MRVEVINTGTELLLGSVTNSHVGYFGRRLFDIGLRIARQISVPDGAIIRDAFLESFGRNTDVLLVTGGLGPTTDDVTREIVAELVGRPLAVDEGVLAAIQERCRRRGIQFLDRMARQALVPEGARVFPNPNGTAPGLYLAPVEGWSWRTPHIFLLPGPPRELRPLFEGCVMPILRAVAGESIALVCRTYRCVGIGESTVEAKIGLRLSELPNLEVGYCARPNEVDFRLIGPRDLVDSLDEEVRQAIGKFIVTTGGESLEELVVRHLRETGQTIATAESCTGGFLAHRLTNVPGASAVFLRGWTVYANAAKVDELGVSEAAIAEHGAVSEVVVGQMAVGALQQAGTDLAVATTGIAGPDGGSSEKPVGTIWMAIARRGGEVDTWKGFWPTERETFKVLATQAILARLLQERRSDEVERGSGAGGDWVDR